MSFRETLGGLISGQNKQQRMYEAAASQYMANAVRMRTRDAMYERAHADAMSVPTARMYVDDTFRGRFFAGANPGLMRPYPEQLNTTEDFKQAYERIVLIRAARQMEEDFPFFDGILSDYVTYVIGDLQYLPETGNPEADKVIRDYLDLQFATCDIQQTRDLKKLSDIAVRTYLRDGECGMIPYETEMGIKIKSISADLIGNPLIGANIGPNNYNGIIVDGSSGAPIFYDRYRRLPKLNCYVFAERIEANNFFHIFDPFRFEQWHGVTAFKNAIEHAFDIYQIVQFSKMNIKYRSSQLPWIKNEQGKPRGGMFTAQPPDSSTGAATPYTINTQGTSMTFLKLNEGIMEFPNDFPNQQFLPMISELKRDCALGAKLPAEFCYRSENGGVIQRFYVSKARATFEEAKRLMRTQFLNPYKGREIQHGIDTGRLDLRAFGTLSQDMARFKGRWQMGRSISVDYGKESDADIKLIDAGLTSPDNYCAEAGTDIRTIRAQLKEHAAQILLDANEVATRTGWDKKDVLPMILKKFANQSSSGAPKAGGMSGGSGGGGGSGVPSAASADGSDLTGLPPADPPANDPFYDNELIKTDGR